MLAYPVKIKKEGMGYSLFIRDLRWKTMGIFQSREEAKGKALEHILKAIKITAVHNNFIPYSTPAKKGDILIQVPFSIELKLDLIRTMYTRNVRPADLAKRMNKKPQEINRILDLTHNTKVDTINDAFNALGFKLHISFHS